MTRLVTRLQKSEKLYVVLGVKHLMGGVSEGLSYKGDIDISP